MKRLSVFFIKSFIGPFLATFFISMFMLVMQFLWKYIDDLMGKGLEVGIIIELLFYVSASLLPLALPLAILLSSLIVMGNLGETSELTALKASGLSIYRILRPLTYVVLLIALGTFYFSNYVIPIANYKWHSIIWDIQEKKMTSFLRPGAYTQEIDGFSIKISEADENHFKNIIIHDRSNSNELKTIIADSGDFYQSENGEFLFFKLYNGNVIEELYSAPDFTKETRKNYYPSRKSDFKTATYKMDMSGFKLQRSKDELFKNNYEMLNVFQIDETVDSLSSKYKEMKVDLSSNTKSKHTYYQALRIKNSNYSVDDENEEQLADFLKNRKRKEKVEEDVEIKDSIQESKEDVDTVEFVLVPPIYEFDKMPDSIKHEAINQMKTDLRTNINSMENQISIAFMSHRSLNRFEIEFHRKFALSFSIIILFFIGAPLGAIVKRGGFGAPVVIAALLFMIYFVLISIGESIATSYVVSPFIGMWGPNFILMPAAIILMTSAAKDKSITVLPKFTKLRMYFKKKKKDA